ncbi:peptidase C13 family protein [Teladorsagia circumcincta]|uniref:Peptidase C13 family protein n=1 Tax=Teladorsagia circumcincta TaxID=45464 RepID=A0A2G9V149_TELCI|nr:peptidase C13 family protein [Teladorsagia circumcincta]
MLYIQADVAHAYHTLLTKGVKVDNIIVMMYDDIANHPENPYKGQLFNSPNGTDVYKGLKIDYRLTVKRLNKALREMHKNHKYHQLVFYLEACESGSMFKKVLKSNINVYAVTAANEEESSWAVYCENDLGLPCLGDEFSVNWMDDSDSVSWFSLSIQ